MAGLKILVAKLPSRSRLSLHSIIRAQLLISGGTTLPSLYFLLGKKRNLSRPNPKAMKFRETELRSEKLALCVK